MYGNAGESSGWPGPNGPGVSQRPPGGLPLWVWLLITVAGVAVVGLGVATLVFVLHSSSKAPSSGKHVNATGEVPPSAEAELSCSEQRPCAATAHTASGDRVTLRAAPNTSSDEDGKIPDGGSLSVACDVEGESVSGPNGISATWDRTPQGDYVADTFVRLTSGSLSPCANAATRSGGSAGAGGSESGSGDADPTLGVVWGSNQQGYGTARPSTVFNGGDPTGLVTDITWSSWGGAQADGQGVAEYVAPNEAVADGHDEPARIRAFDLGSCGGGQRYRAVVWWFPQHGESFEPRHDYNLCSYGG